MHFRERSEVKSTNKGQIRCQIQDTVQNIIKNLLSVWQKILLRVKLAERK